MLLKKNNSALLLIDVQEKLTPHVMQPDALIARCHWLMRLAEALTVPLVISEQYPRGLGKTVAPLCHMQAAASLEKVHFSCYADSVFQSYWQSLKKEQAVLIGIETHVCVLQTALDMKKSGIDVYVVVDAVSARTALDHKYALKRLRDAGVTLVTSEMVFFEWMHAAGTAQFKALSQDFLR